MVKLIRVFFTLFFMLLSAHCSSPIWAAEGRICLECHTQKFLRQNFGGFPERFVYHDQSVYQAKINPCLGIRSLAEELFFTERRLQKYAAIIEVEGKGNPSAQELRKKIYQIGAELEILKKQRINSISELKKGTTALRSELQKIYEQIWQVRGEKDKRWLIGWGCLIFLGFFFLILVGLKKLTNLAKNSAIIILLTVNFVLTSCSAELGEAPKSKDQERLEQALVVAQKRVKEIEEAYQKIVLLITLAKEYMPIDPAAAKQTWKLTWEIGTYVKEQSKEANYLEEVARSVSFPAGKINPDSVRELQEKIEQIRGSIFLLRFIAEEWTAVDHKEGLPVLRMVTDEVLSWPEGDLRDRELKALAEIWTDIEKEEALKLISKIKEPFGQTLSLGRFALAQANKDQALVFLQQATKKASLISQPWHKVQALIRLSAWIAQIDQKEGEKYAELTWPEIEKLLDQQLQSWAKQEMIKSWAQINPQKAEEWLKKIPPDFAESRVYALWHLARSSPAAQKIKYLLQVLTEAKEIADEFERAKLSNLALQDLLLIDQKEGLKNLWELKDPFLISQMQLKILRSTVMADKKSGLKWAQNISEEELRHPLILELLRELLPSQREELLSIYKEVFRLATYISPPYQRWLILRELSEKWGRLDPEGKISCLKEAEKIMAQIPASEQKTEILSYLATSWKSLDEDKSKSLLEEYTRETYNAQKVLENVRLWVKVDVSKAEALAKTLPAKFLLEKILAYKEIARFLKKEKPKEAWKYLEMAWLEAEKLSAPTKIMAELVKEMVAVNKNKVRELISQIPARQERDFLQQELAKTLIKTGQIADLEAAWQISGEITNTSLCLELYEKIATLIKTRKIEQALTKSPLSWLLALQNWPAHKEKAEKEILQLNEQKIKARLLAFWATNLAQTDEEKALHMSENISGLDQEAYSFTLYKIGSQFRKWNRQKGISVLKRALNAAEKIEETDLRLERIHQLTREIYYLDQDLAQNILKKFLAEFPWASKKFLLTLGEWNPHLTRQIAREVGNPYDQAQIILQGAEVLMTKEWIENNKLLEAAWQWAKRTNNSRGQGEVAEIWILCQEQKGWEIWRQVGSPEERLRILGQVLQRKNYMWPGEIKMILEKAIAEIIKIADANQRIKFLLEIGRSWKDHDEDKAREVLSQAYHLATQAVSGNY